MESAPVIAGKVNAEAYLENARNMKHCKVVNHNNGITTLTVDSKRATYRGVPAELLSDEQKKKLENIILFTHIHLLKQIPVITYS